MTKKKNIILISGLILFCLLYIILFYFLSGSSHVTEGYLVVSDLGGYYCRAKLCSYKTVEEMDLENRLIHVYQQNQDLGTYHLQYANRWNFFQNNSWKNLYGDFFGVDDSLNGEVLPYRFETMTSYDFSSLNEVLLHHNISFYHHLNTDRVLIVDLDQNGVEDRIYALSNQTEEENETIYFSTLFVELNGKIQEVYFHKSEESYQNPYYNVFSIFRLDEEKQTRIILNKGFYDQTGEPSILMLQLDGKKMKEVVSDSAKK